MGGSDQHNCLQLWWSWLCSRRLSVAKRHVFLLVQCRPDRNLSHRSVCILYPMGGADPDRALAQRQTGQQEKWLERDAKVITERKQLHTARQPQLTS